MHSKAALFTPAIVGPYGRWCNPLLRGFPKPCLLYTSIRVTDIASFQDIVQVFADGFQIYFKEVALALLPIVFIFAIFQIVFLHFPKKQLIKIVFGLVYTYLGLVTFLTGVNVAFSPVGNLLGSILANLPYNWILIPLGVIMGFFEMCIRDRSIPTRNTRLSPAWLTRLRKIPAKSSKSNTVRTAALWSAIRTNTSTWSGLASACMAFIDVYKRQLRLQF